MSPVTIRPVRPEDVPAVVAMVHELADYHRAADRCGLTDEQLHAALFAPRPTVFGHLAAGPDGEPLATALWFLTFSTWEGTHGIHLEDLYVRPAARRGGVGRDLLATLAALCVARGYRRLEWATMSWSPARAFYTALGAELIDDQVQFRLDGPVLHRLAARSSASSAANR